MKSWLKIGALVLAVALLVGTMAPVLAQELDDMYDELERIRQEMEKVESKKDQTQSELSKLGLELEEYTALLDQARYRLDQLNLEIEEQEDLIDEQEKDIEDKQQEIAETEEHLDEQTGYLEQRMRAMYKNGAVSYLEVMFSATSFSDFLSRLKFLGTIIASDSELINEVRETRDFLAREKIELEDELDLLVERKAQLESDRSKARAEESKIAELVDQRKEQERKLKTALANQEQSLGGLEKDYDELDRLVTEILAQEEWNSGEAPSGFTWPVPVTRYISSPFGWRTIYGRPNWHRGIDIAPSHRYWPASVNYQGTPAYIVAAAPGEVLTSAYNSSYGWYVLIAHGGGYATLYAHQHQRPMVSVGDIVTRGQRIGIVGSTGNSTGPHLHFEVRVNSEPVNPMNFHYN